MEKYKYAKCEITFCSDEYTSDDLPIYVIIMFSEEDLKNIKKHMEYAKENTVAVRMSVVPELYIYDIDDEPVYDSGTDESSDDFIPSNGFIYIYASGFYFKGYNEGGMYIESDHCRLNDLKDIEEWPKEI